MPATPIPALAHDIARHLQTPLGRAYVGRFSDGEVNVELMENVRGRDVFILQPTCPPANDNLMELLVMVDACRRASAARITAVVPYFGYARQDRRLARHAHGHHGEARREHDLERGRQSRCSPSICTPTRSRASSISRWTMCTARRCCSGDAWQQRYQNMIVVSPDVGGVVRARALAKRLDDADLAIIDKRRPRPNESKVMNIIGEVEGKTCVLIDDMVDTAGTLCQAAQALKDEGAVKVVAYITHPVLSGKAVERISKSALDELVVTDTIPLSRRGEGVRPHPPAVGRGAAGRDHSPHPRRRVGQLAVRRLSSERAASFLGCAALVATRHRVVNVLEGD